MVYLKLREKIMNRKVAVIILSLVVFNISGQELDLIPRRVYFVLESNGEITSPLYIKLPDFIHSAISRYQPVVRVFKNSGSGFNH